MTSEGLKTRWGSRYVISMVVTLTAWRAVNPAAAGIMKSAGLTTWRNEKGATHRVRRALAGHQKLTFTPMNTVMPA